MLNSNYRREPALQELEAYALLTSADSYCVVFDTLVEELPDEIYVDRPWHKGKTPKAAVWEYSRRLND